MQSCFETTWVDLKNTMLSEISHTKINSMYLCLYMDSKEQKKQIKQNRNRFMIQRTNFCGSVTQTCLILCDPKDCSMPSLPAHHWLLEPVQIHVPCVSDVIQPSHPLLSHSPSPFNFSLIRVFSYKSVLRIRWPKYWSFRFSISPSNEYSGLIYFRMDWLDLLAVQGTLKHLQYCSSKTSVLQYSASFIVQLSHLLMTTGKTIVLTRWTYVNKVMSLLFNIQSVLVIAFLPRSKHLLI